MKREIIRVEPFATLVEREGAHFDRDEARGHDLRDGFHRCSIRRRGRFPGGPIERQTELVLEQLNCAWKRRDPVWTTSEVQRVFHVGGYVPGSERSLCPGIFPRTRRRGSSSMSRPGTAGSISRSTASRPSRQEEADVFGNFRSPPRPSNGTPIWQRQDAAAGARAGRRLRRQHPLQEPDAEGWILSLSGWRDEKSVVRWRTNRHHMVQEKGRSEILLDYHLRVGQVTGTQASPRIARGAAAGRDRSRRRHDGDADRRRGRSNGGKASRGCAPNFSALIRTRAGCGWDVFDAVLTPGDLILLLSWRDKEAAEAFEASSRRACGFVVCAWCVITACSIGGGAAILSGCRTARDKCVTGCRDFL